MNEKNKKVEVTEGSEAENANKIADISRVNYSYFRSMRVMDKAGARTQQVSGQRPLGINVSWINVHEFGPDVGVQLLVQRHDLWSKTTFIIITIIKLLFLSGQT